MYWSATTTMSYLYWRFFIRLFTDRLGGVQKPIVAPWHRPRSCETATRATRTRIYGKKFRERCDSYPGVSLSEEEAYHTRLLSTEGQICPGILPMSSRENDHPTRERFW